jgi:hypothetical protein
MIPFSEKNFPSVTPAHVARPKAQAQLTLAAQLLMRPP